jgi:hypothetical protein
LARLYSDSVYYGRAREFNDPNFGFTESCTKKNALNKLARLSRVRHNAKSIENRYNSFKILPTLDLQLATGIAATTHWSINIALMIYYVIIN